MRQGAFREMKSPQVLESEWRLTNGVWNERPLPRKHGAERKLSGMLSGNCVLAHGWKASLSRKMALRVTRSFLARAMKASFGGFPALRSAL